MTEKVLPRFRPGYGKANASHGVSALHNLVPRSTLSPPLCYVRGGSSLAGCSASLASVLSPVPSLHPRQYLGEHEGTRRRPAQGSGPASKSKCPLHGAVARAGPVGGGLGAPSSLAAVQLQVRRCIPSENALLHKSPGGCR